MPSEDDKKKKKKKKEKESSKAPPKDDKKKKKKKKEPEPEPETTALVVANNKDAFHCHACGHDNDDISVDEDGDLVCEECGEIIEQPGGGGGGGGGGPTPNKKVILCENCNFENVNPTPDEDGDLVCEECGDILPAQDMVIVCDVCGTENINPERDEDGDLVCEDCGEILPEPIDCPSCGHHNLDPKRNRDGEYICDKCNEVLPHPGEGEEGEEEEQGPQSKADKLKSLGGGGGGGGGGQKFDESGRPTTGTDGKKLTPADMFGPGDVITVTVGKSHPKQDAGLKIEQRTNNKYYVRKVPSSGLFCKTPVIAGDKILELNGKDYKDYKNANEMKKVIKDAPKIQIVVIRPDLEKDESANSDIDFDTLAAITPEGVQRDEIDERDDDTVGYDGKDCGCSWCPHCHA